MRATDRTLARRCSLAILALSAIACGTPEVKITPGKPPPDVRQEGDAIRMPVGNAVILSADSDSDGPITLEATGPARILPTARERLFVLVGQTPGVDTVTVRIDGKVAKTFGVTVMP